MFYVYDKEPRTYFQEVSGVRIKRKVYSVQYKNGYPFFTLFENGRWVTRSAKHYIPIDEEYKEITVCKLTEKECHESSFSWCISSCENKQLK